MAMFENFKQVYFISNFLNYLLEVEIRIRLDRSYSNGNGWNSILHKNRMLL